MYDEFDFNHDGELDAAESAYMHDTLFGDLNSDDSDDYDDEYDEDDDDDDYYHSTYGSSLTGSSYRSSSVSTYRQANISTNKATNVNVNTYKPTYRKHGLTVGQSILYGLIAYVLFFGLLGVTFDGSAEYLPLILWGIISAALYFITNN